MHLIQILLPLADNDGAPFAEPLFRELQAELTEGFGGLTAFSRAPAKGVWNHDGDKKQDDIIIVEVMSETLDRPWWREFRLRWEKKLRQETLLVRVQTVALL